MATPLPSVDTKLSPGNAWKSDWRLRRPENATSRQVGSRAKSWNQ